MIPTHAPSLDSYWTTLAQQLPIFSENDQHVALTIYRELARGEPLTAEQLAHALDVPIPRAREALARESIKSFTYSDDQGRLLGFGGLATAPMHHRFEVKGHTLWTWCAWDSLFLPELLGETARVASPDPETGEVVRLTVAPDRIQTVQPTTAVLSFLSPKTHDLDTSARNAMANFCHFVFFFASHESGERWATKHPGTFLYTLEDASELAKRVNQRNFGHALRSARQPAGSGR